jgi:hypothetical protein
MPPRNRWRESFAIRFLEPLKTCFVAYKPYFLNCIHRPFNRRLNEVDCRPQKLIRMAKNLYRELDVYKKGKEKENEEKVYDIG